MINLIAILRRLTSSNRLSAEIVISAISRAMAAPSLMAIPTSAADRAGESLIPSPSMMTLCPSARADSTKWALSSGSTSERYSSTPTCAAIAAAVRSLSPVSITILCSPSLRRALTTAAASGRRGSDMQMTAASFPLIARYRWENSSKSASKRSCSPSGITHFSSSNTKCALPMITFSPATVLAMPCATRYST